MRRHHSKPSLLLALSALLLSSLLAPFNYAQTAQPSTGPYARASGTVYATAMESNGKVIVGGNFTAYDRIEQNKIVRLHADGQLDPSFDSGLGADVAVWAVALQPDGKIIIGGDFTSYDDIERSRLARLHPDGHLDPSFDPGAGVSGTVYAIAVQADGKMIVGGNFTDFGGVEHNRIVRVHKDGQIDKSFDAGTGTNGTVWTIALQEDGKIIIGGDFTAYNGLKRSRVVRLQPDGQLDLSFDAGRGANSIIYTTALLPGGKIVVGGNFTAWDKNKRNRVARLNADGSLDASFDSGTGANEAVYAITLEPGGQIIVKGDFTNYNGVECPRVVRLNTDGSVDASFDSE
jgi:uncharacterized delta-60 repeat protein